MAKADRKRRLDAILIASGAATQDELDSGQWSEGVCPFEFREPNGAARINIDKGDVLLRATGATLDEALSKLEAKVGILAAKEGV